MKSTFHLCVEHVFGTKKMEKLAADTTTKYGQALTVYVRRRPALSSTTVGVYHRRVVMPHRLIVTPNPVCMENPVFFFPGI